jgi:hypothetical protein
VPAHKPGQSIEGEKISGHSRDPLRSQPAKIVNGVKCFFFKAEFNVVAEITVELAHDTPQIDDNALITKGEKLGCNSALIAIIAKTPTPRQRDLFQEPASHVSHTHGANMWESKQQTNVKVITPRQEIIDALQKRKEIAQQTERSDV